MASSHGFENRAGALLIGGLCLLLAGLLGACEARLPDAGTQAVADEAAYSSGPVGEAGTGRFYMGREIGSVMGHRGIAWLERPSRASLELPDRVVQALDLSPTDVVADVGAGSGYFTFRIAPHVPYGRVLAVDIQPEMIGLISARRDSVDADNVVPVLGTERDPRLPEGEVDVVLMVGAYHEFSQPREMMRHVFRALRPGGRVVLVEYRAEDPTVPVPPLHRMSAAQAQKEMEAVGLVLGEKKDILPQQHFLVFRKPQE